ncbi:MAG: glycosyltransferase family A protein [Patescibacteria group bacterium]
MNPLTSVIIPVYNHLHTLQKCLESIVNQTYFQQDFTFLEFIIVNDGSTDGFEKMIPQIVETIQFPATEQRSFYAGENEIGASYDLDPELFKVDVKIINQENQGAAVARNRGFAESKGEYVIFWDADTIARPDMLEKMLNALQKHPEASYAYSRFKFGWKTIKSQPFDAEKLKQVNYIDVTSLIRRVDFLGFDESIKRFQDWDMWLSLLERGKIGVFIPKVLYKKLVGDRKGISSWLPSFFYKLPWKTKQVKKYEEAKEIIIKKHKI